MARPVETSLVVSAQLSLGALVPQIHQPYTLEYSLLFWAFLGLRAVAVTQDLRDLSVEFAVVS